MQHESIQSIHESILFFTIRLRKTVFAIFLCIFLLYLLAYSSIDTDDKQIAIAGNNQRNALFSKLILILEHIVVTF